MKATRSMGRQVDFLHGPILKPLLIFAIPVLISNIFQQCYNLADTIIVAYFLGDSALAAIGACASIYDLLVGFALGIGSGLSVVTARSYGAGDRELLKKSVAVSLIIGLVTSVAISVLAQLILRPLLTVLNTPADILEDSYRYISSITQYTIVMFAYNLFASLLRAVGDSVMPLVFLILSSVLNIVLDIVFIAQFSMGVAGAAYATVISQAISALLCAVYLLKKVPLLLPEKRHFQFDRLLYFEMLGQGLSIGFMNSIVSAGTVVLQYGINGFGTLIIAGHTAARKLYGFFTMPFGALAQSVSTFVAQNRGAGRMDRVRRGFLTASAMSLSFCAVVSALVAVFARPLLCLFIDPAAAQVLDIGVGYLRSEGLCYVGIGMLFLLYATWRGLEKAGMSVVLTIISLGLRVLLAYTFAPTLGLHAIWWAIPIGWLAADITGLVALRKPFTPREAPARIPD